MVLDLQSMSSSFRPSSARHNRLQFIRSAACFYSIRNISMTCYVLSSSAEVQQLSNGRVAISNGLNARWEVNKGAADLLKIFSSPCTINQAIDSAGATEEARDFLKMMVRGLVLVSEEVDHEVDMRLAWDCLSEGTENDVAFVIDNEARTMDEFRKSGEEGVEALNDLVSLNPAWHVVNIGCGMGRLDLHLSPRVASVYGFDVSEGMLERGRKYLSGCSNVKLSRTDWQLAGIDSENIDLVISFLVFQHCPEEVTWRYFGEAYRVLRRGGRFVFQILCYEDGIGDEAAERSPLARYYGAGKPRYRENVVRGHLEDLGFSIEAIREGHHEGIERRLAGTSSRHWKSMICHALKD